MKSLFLTVLGGLPALYQALTPTDVSISVSSSPSQVINGIGASGAWWPIDLANFPDNVRSQVAEMLFDSSASQSGGAGLTSFRYNIGGGGSGVTDSSRAAETFFVSPGVYNWSADAAGVYFLMQAASYNVPVITAFVNSAPPAFTSNNQACGGTLRDDSIQDFAQYLADVISHLNQEGAKITHVSPMNEPDDSFGTCGQEGMEVTTDQRAQVVNALRSALDSAGLQNVLIMADESSETSNFIPEAPSWLPEAAGGIGMMGSLGRSLSGKETWFTEICCYGASDSSQSTNPAATLAYAQGFDPTMVGALRLGQIIFQSFTQILDAHFDFWTALSSEIGCEPTAVYNCQVEANSQGWNDGLLYYDPDFTSNGNTNIYATKSYYLFKHFARFVFMGATRYEVEGLPDNVLGLAFRASSAQNTELGSAQASLILMNLGTTTYQVDFSSAGLGTAIGGVITSQEYDWQEGTVSGSSVQLPSNFIISVLFS